MKQAYLPVVPPLHPLSKTFMMNARYAALLSLLRCERDGRYSNLEIDAFLKKNEMEKAERNLYTTLVYGVTERKITLDAIIAKLSSKPLDRLEPKVIEVLRMGLYQMIWLDRIPDSAAVNESVNLIKRVRPSATSFVNAILRGFIRGGKRVYPDKTDSRYLSVRYSVGDDVLNVLKTAVADIEPMLAAMENQPHPTLRVNTLKLSRENAMKKLAEAGVDTAATPYSPYGVRLVGHAIPEAVTAMLDNGEVFVQDEASQLAVLAAAPAKGMNVTDVCACPGGKSFSAAMMMENDGSVQSFDLHRNKLSLVEKGAEKLGISVLTTAESDGSVYREELCESADRVLCDVPCSGLGVLSKKPELRYHTKDTWERLPQIQSAILSNVSRYVKKGGMLCYSTCTLNPDENGGVIEKFLSSHSDFEPEEFAFERQSADERLPDSIRSEKGQLTLYPQIHGTDGFFIALLKKI